MDWNKVDAWKATLSQGDLDYITRNSGLKDTPMEAQYRTDRTQIEKSGYFDTSEAAWKTIAAGSPDLQKFATYDDWYASILDEVRKELVASGGMAADAKETTDSLGIVKIASQMIGQSRLQWENDHPAEAVLAWQWGYLNPGKDVEPWLTDYAHQHPELMR